MDTCVEEYSTNIIERQINPESVLAACDRNKISKGELSRMSLTLPKELKSRYNLLVLEDDDEFRKLARSDKYNWLFYALRQRKPTDFNALHDAVAEVYVMEKRGKVVFNFLNSKSWFVQGSSLNLYKPKKKRGLPPFISSAVLVNILWLSNPKTRANLSQEDIADIGITKLISSTLDGALPPQSVLRNFDKNISSLSDTVIDISDCVIVATKMAEKDIINSLNETIEKNLSHPEIINEKVRKYKDDIDRRDEMWRVEIREFISTTQLQFSKEKAELLAEKQTAQNQTTQLMREQNQLRQHLISLNVNMEFNKWKNFAYLSMFLLIICISIIILSIFFQHANWNFISKFYTWVDHTEDPRKEFIIVGCIDIFFGLFGTFCIKTIWERWLNKKKRNKKRQELAEEYKTEVEKFVRPSDVKTD